MYLGRLCEIAPSDLLYQAPAHHYTAALLASAVEPDPRGDADVRGGPVRRTAEPDQPALGLPLPHPLPAGRGALRRGGARNARPGAGPPGGLPLPHRLLSPPPVAGPGGAGRVGRLPRPLRGGAAADRRRWPSSASRRKRRCGTTPPCAGRTTTWSLANGVWDNIRHVDDFVRWTETLEHDGVRGGQLPRHPALEPGQALPAPARSGGRPGGADDRGWNGPRGRSTSTARSWSSRRSRAAGTRRRATNPTSTTTAPPPHRRSAGLGAGGHGAALPAGRRRGGRGRA